MSYWHQMYHRTSPSPREVVYNGTERFKALLACDLGERDRSFAESLQSQHDKQEGALTEKQIECLVRLEDRYSEAAIQSRRDWQTDYYDNYRDTAVIAANYYATTQYFRDLALSIITDEAFVPPRRQFEAMTQNKYAQKAIKVATTETEFPVGSLCKVRNRRDSDISARHRDQLALVVKTHRDGLYGSSTVLVNGETVKYEDRFLKQLSRKNNKKN